MKKANCLHLVAAPQRRKELAPVTALVPKVCEISQVDLEEIIYLVRLHREAREKFENLARQATFYEVSDKNSVNHPSKLTLEAEELLLIIRLMNDHARALEEKREYIVKQLETGATVESGVHTAAIEKKLVVR